MINEFYLGSYALEDQTSIYKYNFDDSRGKFLRTTAIDGIANPSYLYIHPNGKIMYSVEELNPEGRIAVYSLEKEKLKYLYSLPSQGADPCHLALDEQGEFLFVSNYTSGSLSVFRLDEQGKPVFMSDHKQHTGRGKEPERQEGPHVHFSKMIEGILFVCDLGLDCIICYTLDRTSGKIEECGKIFLPQGSGPRHFAVHERYKNFLYVICELTGDVYIYQKKKSDYEMIQKICSLDDNFRGENTAAAIKFSRDGRVLLVSNRGSDSITSFVVQEDGLLEKKNIISSGGSGPRDFEVFGKYLIIANQYSGNLAVIEYSEESGKLKLLASREKVDQPVMLCPIIKL
ncbi:lactonase family protein [Mediterraneibacter sp. NSJ-55]|uniref:Lactonase family protein n=1 Tax=Mediterraneibacter hominis TaxID=2763054 RepID=A0A923LI29_9FIRM|nr:lactonase family protein [Mediterraneibacter hominis]MBC5689066.1 lactonase family protein [Mediterraneibacter hominis]